MIAKVVSMVRREQHDRVVKIIAVLKGLENIAHGVIDACNHAASQRLRFLSLARTHRNGVHA